MDEVSWVPTGAAPWLVTARPDSEPAVGGITFGAGLLHQPTEQLGVAALLAAWLATSLTRPVEAVDAPADPIRVSVSLDQTDTSLVVVGGPTAVATALARVDQLLADPGAAVVDEGLRDRSRTYANPLGRWSAHLAARWPGHRPHLSVLGPLALSGLAPATLAGFVADRLLPAGRVRWTNQRQVRDRVTAGSGELPPPTGWHPPAPVGRREQPGSVVQRCDGELFTTAMPAGPATEIGLSLLARALHRRMVEFEALATEVRVQRYRVGGGLVLACADADLLPGKEAAARAAAVQTVEDLAAGSIQPAEIDQVRDAYANEARAAEPYQPLWMWTLALRQVRQGGFPTLVTIAEEYAQTDQPQVRAALAGMLPELLLSVPAAEPASPPFPLAAPVPPRKLAGRRFRSRVTAGFARCSPDRVGVATGGQRPADRASVDFAEVALRLDTGDQSTTLVDRRLRAVELAWGAYRRGGQLRELVDRHTPDVPVVRQPSDPEWEQQLAAAIRKHRRPTVIGLSLLAGFWAALIAVIAIGVRLDDRELPDPPTAQTVDAGTTVTLVDGGTLGIVAGPELIEHYVPDRPFSYAVQLRLCGGDNQFNSLFTTTYFRLDVGEQRQTGFSGITERPGPPEQAVTAGQCATGWLLYSLAEPAPDEPVTLHFTNNAGDRVTWRMPSDVDSSPVSKPCPTAAPDGRLREPVWQGCPTPPG